MSSVIGFSTGSLKWQLGIKEAITVIHKNNFNGILLSFDTPLKLMQDIGDYHLGLIADFEYVAIHAPYLKIHYSKKSKMIMRRLEFLKKITNAQHIVFHPTIIEDWRALKNSSLPVVIENMDSDNHFGTTIEHMKFFKERGFDIVLDIAHSYTFDKELKLAKQIMKLKPVHVHVSGEMGGKHHLPLSESVNKSKIIRVLKGCKVPLILETNFTKRNDELMKKEISLLKSHHKK